jgi:hypothetical protein
MTVGLSMSATKGALFWRPQPRALLRTGLRTQCDSTVLDP